MSTEYNLPVGLVDVRIQKKEEVQTSLPIESTESVSLVEVEFQMREELLGSCHAGSPPPSGSEPSIYITPTAQTRARSSSTPKPSGGLMSMRGSNICQI